MDTRDASNLVYIEVQQDNELPNELLYSVSILVNTIILNKRFKKKNIDGLYV